MTRPIPASDYVANFNPSLAHHRAWLLAVLERLVSHEPEALQEGQSLRVIWEAPKASKAAQAPSPRGPGSPNPLKVPYYSQRDSATNEAMRMCFTSSCAMMLESLKPGTLKGANGDDQYLATVRRFGDTTDSNAQIKALAAYGVTATQETDCTLGAIENQIDNGIPVPIGIIHKGSLASLYGGGHWICVVGYDKDDLIVHDPFGELDLLNGGYLNTNGAWKRYSKKNLSRRWELAQTAGGGFRYAEGNGWAIIAKG